jgi:hypothetical protein
MSRPGAPGASLETLLKKTAPPHSLSQTSSTPSIISLAVILLLISASSTPDWATALAGWHPGVPCPSSCHVPATTLYPAIAIAISDRPLSPPHLFRPILHFVAGRFQKTTPTLYRTVPSHRTTSSQTQDTDLTPLHARQTRHCARGLAHSPDLHTDICNDLAKLQQQPPRTADNLF